MNHMHSIELSQAIVSAAITGQPMKLPDCCVDDVITLAVEMLDDDRVLSATVIE